MKDIAAIVLAGGKGVRMKSDLPKVLHSMSGKPLIEYVIDSLQKAGISDIVVVVGYKGQMVIDRIGDRVKYVWQHEQLGTGHAVMQAEDLLKHFQGKLVIACGDVPMIKPETFKSMSMLAEGDDVKALVLTMTPDEPGGYGRIVKDDKGDFVKIVEEKDATSDEKNIREVNTGTYVFDKEYLFNGLNRVDCNNAQCEYYLPDALNHVIESGFLVDTFLLDDPFEGSGINSKEELMVMENYLIN